MGPILECNCWWQREVWYNLNGHIVYCMEIFDLSSCVDVSMEVQLYRRSEIEALRSSSKESEVYYVYIAMPASLSRRVQESELFQLWSEFRRCVGAATWLLGKPQHRRQIMRYFTHYFRQDCKYHPYHLVKSSPFLADERWLMFRPRHLCVRFGDFALSSHKQ